MNITLKKPYKINSFSHERYDAHYDIPSADALIVPTKHVGDQALCDIRWENSNGELKVLHEKMFITENLVRLNPLSDDKLYEIWAHYYTSILLN
jgi:hypothetical protein